MNYSNKAIFQMLLCALLWSVAGIFIKLIPWNAFVISGIRSLIAGLTLYTFMRIEHRKVTINKKTIVAGLITALVYSTFVLANKLTTAANAIVLQFSSPMFIIAISVLFYKQKISRADIIAVIATMLGISLFFFDQLSGGYLYGNILSIVSGVLMAIMYIAMGNVNSDERFTALLLGQVFAFLISVPFIIATKPEMTLMPIVYILILGVFQIGMAYVLYAKALDHCPPLACNLLGALEPLLNPVWVFIFDGERPGFFALIGGVIVIASVTLWCIYGKKSEDSYA